MEFHDLRYDNKSTMASVGDALLTPARVVFGGRTVRVETTSNQGNAASTKVQQGELAHPIVRITTLAASLLLLPIVIPATLLGWFLKTIDQDLHPEIKKINDAVDSCLNNDSDYEKDIRRCNLEAARGNIVERDPESLVGATFTDLQKAYSFRKKCAQEVQKRIPTDYSEKDKEDLAKLITYREQLERYAVPCKNFDNKFKEDLAKLKTGDSLVIPMALHGHLVSLYIEKQEDGSFLVKLQNRGDGIQNKEFHPCWNVGGDKSICKTVVTFKASLTQLQGDNFKQLLKDGTSMHISGGFIGAHLGMPSRDFYYRLKEALGSPQPVSAEEKLLAIRYRDTTNPEEKRRLRKQLKEDYGYYPVHAHDTCVVSNVMPMENRMVSKKVQLDVKIKAIETSLAKMDRIINDPSASPEIKAGAQAAKDNAEAKLAKLLGKRSKLTTAS